MNIVSVGLVEACRFIHNVKTCVSSKCSKVGVENVNVGIIKSQCGFESGSIIENHVVMS